MAASLHNHGKGIGENTAMSKVNQILSLIQSGVQTTDEIVSYFQDEVRRSAISSLIYLRKNELITRDISTGIYTIREDGIDKLALTEERNQRESFENTVLSQALKEWLAESDNLDRLVSAKELNTALKAIAEKQQLAWRWKNASGFGMHLSALAKLLNKTFGMEIQEETARTGKLYKFTHS